MRTGQLLRVQPGPDGPRRPAALLDGARQVLRQGRPGGGRRRGKGRLPAARHEAQVNSSMRNTWRILFIPNYVLACIHENTDDFCCENMMPVLSDERH